MNQSTFIIEEAVEKPASEEPCEILAPGSEVTSPNVVAEILNRSDPKIHAKSMSDNELLSKVELSLSSLRENLPYIREARDRFSKPGRRLPVDGEPTWSEWVEKHLPVGMRRIQQLLATPKPAPFEPAEKAVARAAVDKTKKQTFKDEGDSGVSCVVERSIPIDYFMQYRNNEVLTKQEVRTILQACGWRIVKLELEEQIMREENIHTERQPMVEKEKEQREKESHVEVDDQEEKDDEDNQGNDSSNDASEIEDDDPDGEDPEEEDLGESQYIDYGNGEEENDEETDE